LMSGEGSALLLFRAIIGARQLVYDGFEFLAPAELGRSSFLGSRKQQRERGLLVMWFTSEWRVLFGEQFLRVKSLRHSKRCAI
jgi:hypothetical protein